MRRAVLSIAIGGAPNGGGPASDLHTVVPAVRRRGRVALGRRFSCHTFRAMGITAYLKNGECAEVAQRMAGHSKTTGLSMTGGTAI
jgi:integrase